MAANNSGQVSELLRLESRWLHDVAQVDGDIYIFSLGDRNELSVVDIGRRAELGRFSFESRGVNVQFLCVARENES